MQAFIGGALKMKLKETVNEEMVMSITDFQYKYRWMHTQMAELCSVRFKSAFYFAQSTYLQKLHPLENNRRTK